jgi:signal transduction histidine kinase
LGFLEKDIASGRTDRATEDVERIRAATETMEQLLRELLELSRVGRVANPSEDVSLRALALETREALAGVLAAAGAEVEIDADLPLLYGDRARLREVLQNLIENAAKFARPGTSAHIRVGSRPGPQGPVCFVEDDGIGIDPRQHQRVFGLFERLDPDTPGTGIGLALVKRIIEVHGGRVWVESEGASRGSRFCFTLAPRSESVPGPALEVPVPDQEGLRGPDR